MLKLNAILEGKFMYDSNWLVNYILNILGEKRFLKLFWILIIPLFRVKSNICDTMGGIHFCGCGYQSENPFVCFGAKPTQRACARDLPRDRKKTRKGRSQRRGKDSRHERAVKRRRTQSAESSRRDQSTEQVSQEMRVGQREDQSSEVRKAAARTCWSTDAGLTNARSWVSIPSGFVEVSRKYTPAIACKCTESGIKVSDFPPSCAWS